MSDHDFTDGSSDEDPLASWLSQFGFSFDASTPEAYLEQIQRMVSSLNPQVPSSSSVWDQAKDRARDKIRDHGADPAPTMNQQQMIADADRLANSWLDAHTSFESLGRPAQGWTRTQWIDHSFESWRTIAEPVSTRLGDAFIDGYRAEMESMGEHGQMLAQFADSMSPMLKGSATGMYAHQLTDSLAKLASTIITGTEIGIPSAGVSTSVILPHNLDDFAKDLSLDIADLYIYFAIRESARQRLFSSVGWLEPQILALVEHYARETEIDPSAFQVQITPEQLTSLTPDALAEWSKDVERRLFSPTATESQQDILTRLETVLAMIEGWVDVVTNAVASQWMPDAHVMADEMIRRRRASNDGTGQFFSSLVGLEISQRRIRDAAELWRLVTTEKGIERRDELWSHPDLAPQSADLDDPHGFLQRMDGSSDLDEMDAALSALLDQAQEDEQE